ncbi:PKD domain-containing protein [Hymenobacter cellulosivorans]|uniref:PKD domain-containing protein n=1 Tax=Hymenobacter cellulosivorans TaxID=2932249 RepID=A0ABY4FFG4_9BACT|nr:PKD domain-containing protein [Hymenobacter cellulosivorans]UOQ55433.1 PKD domain-containing protein [Hymenobacter cellulosivorans]
MKNYLPLITSICLASCSTDSEVKPAEIKPATANFEMPESNEASIATVFQNKSLAAKRYAWSFGDGSTSTDENPTHTYTRTGQYLVKLKAFGERNDSITKSITILPYKIFTHSSTRIGGVYSCKIVTFVKPPGSPLSIHRLADKDITITEQAPDKVLWDSNTLIYSSSSSTSRQLPGGPYHTFGAPTDIRRKTVLAFFYTSGDSAVFLIDELPGHGSIQTYYHGKRRP